MFSWAYLKPQDSYTHHTQTHTHLHTPSIPHWKLCRQALPLISSLPTSADMIPAGLHSQGSVCTCLFVAAVRDSPSVSVLASATQKPNAQLICKHTITEPLFASATRRDKMGKIPHKWLPKSSRVVGDGYNVISWTSQQTGIKTRGHTTWEAFTEPATKASRREFRITQRTTSTMTFKGSLLANLSADVPRFLDFHLRFLTPSQYNGG